MTEREEELLALAKELYETLCQCDAWYHALRRFIPTDKVERVPEKHGPSCDLYPILRVADSLIKKYENEVKP